MYTYTTVIYKHYQRTQCTEKKKPRKKSKKEKEKKKQNQHTIFNFFFQQQWVLLYIVKTNFGLRASETQNVKINSLFIIKKKVCSISIHVKWLLFVCV